MTITPISKIESKTHKLRTLKEALKFGYNIPESYLITPPVYNDTDFIASLKECVWLIRPSVKRSTSGLSGGTCKRNDILDTVTEVLEHHDKDVQLILQEYIHSDRAGIMLSSDDIYIESVCGSGFGLTRGGISPSIYSIREDDITADIVRQERQYQMRDGKMVEEECGECSDLSKSLLDQLYEMENDFRWKIVEWCSRHDKLYFLEYWNLTGNFNTSIRGKITHVGKEKYDILLIPNAHIKYFDDAKRARGVIAKIGGYLSHLGVNCLDKGIPFVVSNDEYRDGELVFLDRKEKKITRLSDVI